MNEGRRFRDARRLTALFDRLAAASIASGLLVTPACAESRNAGPIDGGQDADAGPIDGGQDAGDAGWNLPPDTEFGPAIDPSAFTPATCSNGRVDFVGGLMPASPVDGVAAWALEGCYLGLPSLIATAGTPCADTTDPSTCATDFAAPAFASGCGIGLVAEAGGVVSTYVGTSLASFLGTIDNADEAYVIAAESRTLTCDGGLPAYRVNGDGTIDWLMLRLLSTCAPIISVQEVVRVYADGSSTIISRRLVSVSPACIGRVPRGRVRSRPVVADSAAGRHLARMHALEAASICAFEELALALHAHGAPRSLVRSALRAAADERKHARTTARLARRYGAEPEAPTVEVTPLPTLEELALHNATEGCVRETFGALVGRHQARTATDSVVAKAMTVIARDETRHAALSHRIDAWARTRLSSEAGGRLDDARDAAITEVVRDAHAHVDPALVTNLGIPMPATAHALAIAFARELQAERG